MSATWIIIVAVAVIALGLFLFTRRGHQSDHPADLARTEQATHDLYMREDAADHAREDKVER